MNASLLQRAEYREYRGPAGIPDSTTRPYVFSEQVPADKIWMILAASARELNGSLPSALWMYGVPPNPSDVSAGNAVFRPILRPGIFGPPIANQFNTPPLVAGVELSKGGLASGKEMVAESGSLGNQANSCSVNLLPARVILPPRWMLTVMQDGNGGGASNMVITLSLMLIAIGIAEDLGKNNFVSYQVRAFATMVGEG